MAQQDRNQSQDWARDVPEHWRKGPYRDFGWERGESALPEFRDPSVHETDYDERDMPPGPEWQRNPQPRDQQHYTNWRGDQRREMGLTDWQAPGPYTGRGPRGWQRSDNRIYEDVCDRLAEHGGVDASNIQVEVKNAEVTLRGTVDSRAAKRMAEDVTESAAGVRDVHNELKVRQGQGQ